MDLLNNREIAFSLWFILISLFFALSPKMVDVRKSIYALVSVIATRQVITMFSLMLFYVFLEVYILSKFSLWNSGQLKNTVIWCISSGLVYLVNIEKIRNKKNKFKDLVFDQLKILAIIQFIVEIYSFPLWIELLQAPLLALIAGMLVIAEKDDKYRQVKSFLEYCLSIYFLLLISFTLYMLVTDFKEFGQIKTIYDFFTPILLTTFYIPFMLIIMTYSSYEQAFIKVDISIKNKIYKRLAKIYAIVIFNFRTKTLERWASQLFKFNIESHSELLNTFKFIFRMVSNEKTPKQVSNELGWSPYVAKNFLASEGLSTGFYNSYLQDEWLASSPMIEVSDGVMPNNIAYYIEGSEDIVNVLKVKVNVNDSQRSAQATERLMKVAETLSNHSLNQSLSEKMKLAIVNCEPYSEIIDGKIISLDIGLWPNKSNGFDLKFTITRK
ncbi:hypothetical protein [Enterobacter asburiae]|uniref:hypothetical protein n=1 Tax=Enterobacter asburiae TaxID=61645 RepID=UPI001B35AA7E|nr:hypothetical protein [Enterobacter asburiae]MBQ0319498.1 hypothetical protein [Enterobacter asburiae]MBT1864184.1 hypothetical protein [Enterobacter asburiae]MBT1893511.1 hypothetical protein [Enterobacter asburiae]